MYALLWCRRCLLPIIATEGMFENTERRQRKQNMLYNTRRGQLALIGFNWPCEMRLDTIPGEYLLDRYELELVNDLEEKLGLECEYEEGR